jgi:hypothetical protein
MKPWPFPNTRNLRPWRGWDLATDENFDIKDNGHGVYTCSADRTPHRMYTVNLVDRRCECLDWQNANGYKDCKHIYACDFRFGDLAGTESPPVNEFYKGAKRSAEFGSRWWKDDGEPVLPLGKANLKARNEAYLRMPVRMRELVKEACHYAIEPRPAPKGPGKPVASQRDVVIALLCKVGGKVSLRSFSTFINDLYANGYISQTIHYNTLCKAIRSPEYTPVLEKVFIVTTRPYRHVSADAGVDSTQIANGSSANSVDKKSARIRSDRPTTKWLKAHLVWSLENLVILGYVLTTNDGAGSHDSIPYCDAFKMALSNANIVRISGDGSYGSDENIAETIRLGVEPFLKLNHFNWNPKSKVALSIESATAYEEKTKTAHFKAVYNLRNKAECGNKVLKQVTDSFLWTRPKKLDKPKQQAENEQLALTLQTGEKPKRPTKSSLKKLPAEERERLYMEARENVGIGNYNECLLKMIVMNLRQTVVAESKTGRLVDYSDPLGFLPVSYQAAS